MIILSLEKNNKSDGHLTFLFYLEATNKLIQFRDKRGE